ncbi:type II secretion system F family protein [Halorientalis marina]|uniref:type II secretion system F family protein n=1 Tax=Halorientalis marina TaxID=2931976 RepID=UPI001FF6286F|nr:type II secretion system F family protein [Halorientalis marina]
MVSPIVILPALVAVPVVALLVAAGGSESVNRSFARIARVLFRNRLDEGRRERKRLLQSAYVAETYRTYAAKTYLYTVLLSVVGGIATAYVLGGIVVAIPTIGDFLSGLPNTINAVIGYPSEWSISLSRTEWTILLVGGGLVGALLSGGLAYTMRWRLPASSAEARRRQINEGMARTVAFLYAQSRGGMPFPQIMATLSRNREVYGAAADEISVAVREMQLFGTDMITAIRTTSQRTPSEDFKTFSENLASVLQSGQSLPTFLKDQYERYQEEAEERQEEVLELLATIAEAYVTVLVAGTLFIITVLLVFGLTTTDTLWLLQMLGYLLIPLANFGFMVFVSQRLSLLGMGGRSEATVPDDGDTAERSSPTADVPAADGGHVPAMRENFARLARYDDIADLKRILGSPLRTVLRNPEALLYVTVPLAVVVTALRFPAALTGVGVNVRVVDDLIAQALLFVIGTYAIVQYVHKRRLSRIEAATPEFLERLASLNEAGMSIVESFNRVRGSDLGALSEEVERIWADVRIGANVDDALTRFGRRVRTVPVTRGVTLLTNAMRASGNIGAVLRIAANQSRADLRLKRQRRRQMLTYLVVIYVAFLVFLVIIVAVQEVLVPSLPNSVPTPDSNELGVNADTFSRLGSVNKAAYTLVFFHTALIQAVLSGLIGGQIGEGTIRDGAKHAAVLLGVAYVAFVVLSSPVASMSFQEQLMFDQEVEVQSASLSSGGYVVLHLYDENGPVVGTSEYLPAGTSKGVMIQLDRDIPSDATVVAVPHMDTDDDQQFEYDGGELDRPYPPGAEANRAEATVT